MPAGTGLTASVLASEDTLSYRCPRCHGLRHDVIVRYRQGPEVRTLAAKYRFAASCRTLGDRARGLPLKTSRLILPAVFLLLVGGLLAVAGDPPAAMPPGPANLGELDEALTQATERTERLLSEAGRDRRFKVIEMYLTYTIEDFGNRRREIEAEDLLDIVTDADAPIDLRQEAFKALTWKDAMRFDPDLVRERGKSKPRSEFGKKIAKLLTNRDKYTRQLAHNLLITYFKTHKNDPEVVTYDALNGTKSQWAKAKAHWLKVLRK